MSYDLRTQCVVPESAFGSGCARASQPRRVPLFLAVGAAVVGALALAVPFAYVLSNSVDRADKAVEQSDTASSNTTPCHGRAFLHSLLAQDLAAAAMCAQEAQPKQPEPTSVSKYKLRPRRTPRLTQVALQGKGQKQDRHAVEAARQADSLSSKVSEESPMIADGSHRHRRSDVEEQVALVDTLNMLSQLYRDQAGAYHAHFEVMRDMGGIWGIEDHCRRYTMDDNNPMQTDVRKALLRLQMEMTLSEQASVPHRMRPGAT